MPIFHWNYDAEMEELEQWQLERDRREQLAAQIRPGMGERVSEILSHYPWLSPGAIVAAVRDGWDASAPQIGAVADVEFQRRTRQSDWHYPGDKISASGISTAQLFGTGEVSNATQEEAGNGTVQGGATNPPTTAGG